MTIVIDNEDRFECRIEFLGFIPFNAAPIKLYARLKIRWRGWKLNNIWTQSNLSAFPCKDFSTIQGNRHSGVLVVGSFLQLQLDSGLVQNWKFAHLDGSASRLSIHSRPSPKPNAIAPWVGHESFMRQYRVYDLSGTGAPDFYNGTELILAWRIVDNRNGNAVVSIFDIGHD